MRYHYVAISKVEYKFRIKIYMYKYSYFNIKFFSRYTKYVYPYECHMKNLSSPTELQAAIDGNRREGRRAGYESYNMFPGPRPHIPLPPSSLPLPQISPIPPGFRPSFNGTGFPGNILSKSHELHITENQLLNKNLS